MSEIPEEILDKIHNEDAGELYLCLPASDDGSEFHTIVLSPEKEQITFGRWEKVDGEWACTWGTMFFIEVLEDIVWQMTKHKYGVTK